MEIELVEIYHRTTTHRKFYISIMAIYAQRRIFWSAKETPGKEVNIDPFSLVKPGSIICLNLGGQPVGNRTVQVYGRPGYFFRELIISARRYRPGGCLRNLRPAS